MTAPWSRADRRSTLYDRPANLFVASFLGSPAMNFIKGRLVSNGAPKFLSEGGLAIPLASLPAAAGAPVVCGFRPEAVVPDAVRRSRCASS